MTIETKSVITGPECGWSETAAMPIDACQIVYERRGCGAVLRPKAGDYCVFWSFGSVPCPPIQRERGDADRRFSPE
jgi:hypothetical protein